MAVLTFDTIHQIVARHAEAEAAERAPLAVACRALDTLREALEEIPYGPDRTEIMRELYDLWTSQPSPAARAFAAVWATTREG